jgi:predicted AAA+ superfamily ATPase
MMVRSFFIIDVHAVIFGLTKGIRSDFFLSFEKINSRLRHPFTAIVAGPTGCGKTVFAFKLIKQASKMIYTLPENIVYCHGEFQLMFCEYPRSTFNER